MIPIEIANLLRHALRQLTPGIWHIVDDVNQFNPSMKRALSLSPYQYTNFLQFSGIMTRYGQNFRFNLWNLDTTITLFQADNINIHTSWCMFERGGKNLLFLCIDGPKFLSPRNPANSRQRMIFWNNQLVRAYLVHYCRKYPIISLSTP
jgi:hypothetical protein